MQVAAAKAAFALGFPWRTMDGTGRRDLMLKLADLIERDRDYLEQLEALDNGKPLGREGQYGTAVDVHLIIQHYRYFATSPSRSTPDPPRTRARSSTRSSIDIRALGLSKLGLFINTKIAYSIGLVKAAVNYSASQGTKLTPAYLSADDDGPLNTLQRI
jgi:hypothetical protein